MLQDFTRLQPEKIPKRRRNPWKIPQSSHNNNLNLFDFPLLNNSVPQQSQSHVASNHITNAISKQSISNGGPSTDNHNLLYHSPMANAVRKNCPLYGDPSTSNRNFVTAPSNNVSPHNNRQHIVHTLNNRPVESFLAPQIGPQSNPFGRPHPPPPSFHHFNPHVPPPHIFYPQCLPAYHHHYQHQFLIPNELFQNQSFNPFYPNSQWY